MRYYLITITDPNITDPKKSVKAQWSSHLPDGTTPDPGAPKVELDIPLSNYGNFAGTGHITIWGVGLQLISQKNTFRGMNISVTVGMAKGLPLANPNQKGPAIVGTIFQNWGNWINTNQTLEIIFQAPYGSISSPINLSVTWLANTPLKSALQTTLTNAFPNDKISINISPNLVLPNDEPSYYRSLSELGTYLSVISHKIINTPNYAGVSISRANGIVTVVDGTTQSSPNNSTKKIAYTDIIGQPVWKALNTIQVMFVMRGDIFLDQPYFTLPTNTPQTQTQAGAIPAPTDNLSFTGVYRATAIRILGNSRQPHAEAWITVVDAIAQSPGGGDALVPQ